MNNSLDFLITYIEWANIITIKREKRLGFLNTGNKSVGIILENTKDNHFFINLILKLTKKNIFDLSRISYLTMLFLDPYITPYFKHYLETDADILYTNPIKANPLKANPLDTNREQHRDYLPPLDNKITNIIACTIELVIFIELQLNILLFLLNIQVNRSNENINSIKPATLLLLVFNILTKLGSLPMNILEFYKNTNLADDTKNIIPKIKENCYKINELLDKFILDINIYQNHDELWQLCKSHILDIAKCNLDVFGVFLDMIIQLLIQENKLEKDKLNSIHNSITNFLEMEINLFEYKLEQMPYS
jgi:hypothetical protein